MMATIIRTSFSRILAINRTSSALSTIVPRTATRALSVATANRSKRWNLTVESSQTLVCQRSFGTLGPPKKALDLEKLKSTVLSLCRAHDKIDAGKVSAIDITRSAESKYA